MFRRTITAGSVAALAAITLAGAPGQAAPVPAGYTGSTVHFVVDVSGSMYGTPLDQAKAALRSSVAVVPANVAVGLRSYEGECGDGGDLVVPVGLNNRSEFAGAVDALQAGGGTPTPDALRAAFADLPPGGQRRVVLVSDGVSSCGPACPVATELAQRLGVGLAVYTVGFNAPSAAESDLTCVAEATGGTYVQATDTASLQQAISRAVAGSGASSVPVTEGRYVALGDSFSSGEGVPPFDPVTATSGDDPNSSSDNRCHRSSKAYPSFVPAAKRRHAACSGAVLAHLSEGIGGRGQWNEGPQLDAIAPYGRTSIETTLVTLTIGGNDAGFADVLDGCIKGQRPGFHSTADCASRASRLVGRAITLLTAGGRIEIDRRTDPPSEAGWRFCSLASSSSPCRGTGDYRTAEVSDLAGMIGKIRDRAPRARVVVGLYPRLFPQRMPAECIVGQWSTVGGHTYSYTVTSADAAHLNRLTDQLNDAIRAEVVQAAARGLRVSLSDPRAAFDGHAIRCVGTSTDADPWILGALFANRTLNIGVKASPFSFHPNAAGQAAMGAAFNGARQR